MKVYIIRFVLKFGGESVFNGTWAEWTKFQQENNVLRIRKVRSV